MRHYSAHFPYLFIQGILTCLFCILTSPDLLGQSVPAETAYFKDVTASHMPLDEDTHALDVVLVDVNSDGLLDMALALENEPNRLYINDGEGKFIWKEEAFVSKNHDSEHVRA
ncbi:MAG: FG-GAP repeat domain-containing protein, partial [Sphingobacterium sp.]